MGEQITLLIKQTDCGVQTEVMGEQIDTTNKLD